MVAFVSSPRFIEHETGPYHPERPDRIRAIHRAVREAGLIESADPFPDFQIDLGIKRQDAVTLVELVPEHADLKWVRTVHNDSTIQFIQHMCRVGGVLDQGDTPVEPRSFDTALLSLGSLLKACDAVMNGQVLRAFSAGRPPGHHAEPERPMGFCLFSNVAIAAKYLQQQYGLEKIAIVDFDVHHGNGTQAAFESDPSVLFISLHEDPRTCYPGSGRDWEIGTGRGKGFTLNIPLQPGTEDEEYLQAIDSKVIPKLDAFKPQILLVSAGFDAHREDPLANLQISDEGFERITRKLVAATDVHCSGKLISALEGGYNLGALGRSVVRHLIAMSS